ncbi:MAG: hypothetical protein H6608_11880 [Flavobacteriales bacterium]|nr:hypothetical protein [Flavobacteriales bacterium]
MRRLSLFLFNQRGLAQVVFPFLFINCVSGVSAQTPIANLKQDFEVYSNLMKSQEFDTAMNYVVPEFFEITPRSTFVSLMKMTYQLASNMGIETRGYSIVAIDSIVQIDSQFYTILHHTNQMTIPYTEGEAGESAKAKAKQKG